MNGPETDLQEIRKANRRRVLVFLLLLASLLALCFFSGRLEFSHKGMGYSYPYYCHFLIRWSAAGAMGLCLVFIWFFPGQGKKWSSAVIHRLPGIVFAAGFGFLFHNFFLDWISLCVVLPIPILIVWLFRKELGRAIDRLWEYETIQPRWMAALFLISLGLYYFLNQNLYDGGPYFGDSQARLFHAHILAKGMWSLPAPEHPELYPVQWIVFHNGRWFSQYLPGTILLNLMGLKIGNLSIVFSLLGAGCVWLTWRVGREIHSEKTGFLGAALLALSPMFMILSSSFMEHTPATFFLLAALAAGLRNRSAPTALNAFFLGFFLGYACILRPLTSLAVAGPFLAVWFFKGLAHWKKRWPNWILAFSGWCLPMAFLLFFNAKTTGHPLLFGYQLAAPALTELGFSESNLHTPLKGLFQQVNNLTSLSFFLFMWPASSFLPIILLFLLGKSSPRDLLLLAPLAGLTACYFFYPYQDFYFTPRFLAESLPFLALLTARGIMETAGLLDAVSDLDARRSARRILTVLTGVLFLLGFPAALDRILEYRTDFEKTQMLVDHLEEYYHNPLATVFIPPYLSCAPRSLIDNVVCLGGAKFLIDPGREGREAYRRQHPERQIFVYPKEKEEK